MHYRLISATAAALFVVVSLAAAAQELPRRFSAFAVSLGGIRSEAGTAQVDITISRWSTDQEHQRLMSALKEVGPRRMLETLRDLKPVGTIQVDGNLGYNLHYAHTAAGEDGGQRIFLATDRPVSFWEAWNQPRLTEYPFTFIELHVDEDGEGEGKITLAAKVTASADGRFIHLENYATEAIRLNEVSER